MTLREYAATSCYVLHMRDEQERAELWQWFAETREVRPRAIAKAEMFAVKAPVPAPKPRAPRKSRAAAKPSS